ncbi:MAG TPA: hypothetical protein VN604_11570 [Nitrospirota bacterium]|nr:hypothetical protein [Nitrospirota bacterium]
MKKRADDMTPLCVNFCAYYKPGKTEGLACEGFRVVRRLLDEGRAVSFAKRRNASVRSPSAGMLRATMCTNCTFSEADCDFLLTNGEALPCGGFVLLRHLLDEGEITIQEIKSR